jgi:hypothetical protein
MCVTNIDVTSHCPSQAWQIRKCKQVGAVRTLHVPTKFEENPFKDERALNHTRARTHTLAHAQMHAVIEHDKYVYHVTCGHL